MNYRTTLVLEVMKNERMFECLLPHGAPYQDCYDVLQEMAAQVKSMSEAAEAAQKEKDKKEEEDGSSEQSKSA